MSATSQKTRGLADAFKALGHPIRIELLKRILTGEFCVAELQKRLGQSQPSISQHLGVLRDRGIITPVRKGNRTCYQPRNERIADLLGLAEEILS